MPYSDDPRYYPYNPYKPYTPTKARYNPDNEESRYGRRTDITPKSESTRYPYYGSRKAGKHRRENDSGGVPDWLQKMIDYFQQPATGYAQTRFGPVPTYGPRQGYQAGQYYSPEEMTARSEGRGVRYPSRGGARYWGTEMEVARSEGRRLPTSRYYMPEDIVARSEGRWPYGGFGPPSYGFKPSTGYLVPVVETRASGGGGYGYTPTYRPRYGGGGGGRYGGGGGYTPYRETYEGNPATGYGAQVPRWFDSLLTSWRLRG